MSPTLLWPGKRTRVAKRQLMNVRVGTLISCHYDVLYKSNGKRRSRDPNMQAQSWTAAKRVNWDCTKQWQITA